jgi:methylglyoxal synthase
MIDVTSGLARKVALTEGPATRFHGERMTVVLVAHDNRKADLRAWARFNRGILSTCTLYATRSTGETLAADVGLEVNCLLSGPLGGDAQIGSMIAEGRVDMAVFLWDPLTPQPHDVDVKALLRLAVLYDVPIASNRSSADFLISSPLVREYRHYRQVRQALGGHQAPVPVGAGTSRG